ncbi:MAG TPA: hypothetical protein VE617_00330 [Propionibacteriaceae bacterium]|jgi:hypothetical protein|nr:hypothetical protein [Propionibacteriaceae bacterium]
MSTMLFRSEAPLTALTDEGPDNLHAAEAAATVHGDSVTVYGIEVGEASDDDVEARIISAATLARTNHR